MGILAVGGAALRRDGGRGRPGPGRGGRSRPAAGQGPRGHRHDRERVGGVARAPWARPGPRGGDAVGRAGAGQVVSERDRDGTVRGLAGGERDVTASAPRRLARGHRDLRGGEVRMVRGAHRDHPAVRDGLVQAEAPHGRTSVKGHRRPPALAGQVSLIHERVLRRPLLWLRCVSTRPSQLTALVRSGSANPGAVGTADRGIGVGEVGVIIVVGVRTGDSRIGSLGAHNVLPPRRLVLEDSHRSGRPPVVGG